MIILMVFISARTIQFTKACRQKMVLVYNVPKHQAIDIVKGRKYLFISDSSIHENIYLQNLNLQPARTAYRISATSSFISRAANTGILKLGSKKMILIDEAVVFVPTSKKVFVDIIVISKNPSITFRNLSMVFACKLWVFDSSNSLNRVRRWKKECEQLGLSYYDVVDKGAFVMNMD
jgi:competence protein ComEC